MTADIAPKRPAYFRALVPNGRRRALWHDYRGRCIYMLTLNRGEGIPPFSQLKGIPDSHEHKPYVELLPPGRIIAESISELKSRFPMIKLLRRVIMPEHIHFVIFITQSGTVHLGDIVKTLKGECTRKYAGLHGEGALLSMFEDGYHDRILMKQGQLKRMLNYVSDNPRRRLLRQKYPHFHARRMLKDDSGYVFEGYGNLQLLDDFDIEAVRISRRFSAEELRQRKICWKQTVENGGVLVSPFISEAEKKVRNWAMDNGGRLIIIVSNGFGHNYSPKEPLHTLCSAGRLLLIAPMKHETSAVGLTRAVCMKMNEVAETVAAHQFSIC